MALYRMNYNKKRKTNRMICIPSVCMEDTRELSKMAKPPA